MEHGAQAAEATAPLQLELTSFKLREVLQQLVSLSKEAQDQLAVGIQDLVNPFRCVCCVVTALAGGSPLWLCHYV
jgi:hypothetical protein